MYSSECLPSQLKFRLPQLHGNALHVCGQSKVGKAKRRKPIFNLKSNLRAAESQIVLPRLVIKMLHFLLPPHCYRDYYNNPNSYDVKFVFFQNLVLLINFESIAPPQWMTFAPPPQKKKSWNARENFMNCFSLYFILLRKCKSLMTFTRPLASLTQNDLFLAHPVMMETQF